MDLAYDQRAERDRRKNCFLTSINHLSLAPLTVKLPLGDGNDFADMQPPRLLSRAACLAPPVSRRDARALALAPARPVGAHD